MTTFQDSPRSRTSIASRVAAGLALLTIGTVTGGATAHAAPIVLTDVELSISPETVRIGGARDIATEFSGCVPNSAVAGDTVALTLPDGFADWPAGFAVNAGAVVAFDVAISDASPAVATFTLTADGAAIDNLCFDSFFVARWENTEVGTFPLEYEINGEAVVDPPELTVTSGPVGLPPTQFVKSSYFTGSQQCRNDADNCLSWFFSFPVGDIGPIELADDAQPGWTFDCSAVRYRLVTFVDYPDRGARIDGPFITTPGDVTWTCAADEFVANIDTSNLAPNQSWRVDVGADVDVVVAEGGVTYNNEATATVGGDEQVDDEAIQSAFVGGLAQGDLIDIEKSDADGNDADVEDAAVEVASDTELTFVIQNGGTTDLIDVVVSDVVLGGSASVTGLTCAFPDGSTGTAWDGPFASGSQFLCTATLVGVVDTHQNRATVTATGNDDVTDSDDYWAVPTPRVSVGDYVWWDDDEDGVQDEGEDGIADVTLTLTGPDGEPVTDVFGNPVGPTQTDGDGRYGFGDLPVLEPGESYTVTVTNPEGFVPTIAGVGDRATDSSTGSAASTDLTVDGANDPTLDFGFVPEVVSNPPTTTTPPPTTTPPTTTPPTTTPPTVAPPTTTITPDTGPNVLPATGASSSATATMLLLAVTLLGLGTTAIRLTRRRAT